MKAHQRVVPSSVTPLCSVSWMSVGCQAVSPARAVPRTHPFISLQRWDLLVECRQFLPSTKPSFQPVIYISVARSKLRHVRRITFLLLYLIIDILHLGQLT